MRWVVFGEDRFRGEHIKQRKEGADGKILGFKAPGTGNTGTASEKPWKVRIIEAMEADYLASFGRKESKADKSKAGKASGKARSATTDKIIEAAKQLRLGGYPERNLSKHISQRLGDESPSLRQIQKVLKK